MALKLGIIADDYTGATDISVTLMKQGMRVLQTIGVPAQDSIPAEVDALVVALKSRTIPPHEAVAISLECLAVFQTHGVSQVFFKYCSTFDSTPLGNIGPVADALLDALNAPIAFVCPAFPANGRTVYAGHLFVGDTLLSASPMRNHPLTPMKDSNLRRLMTDQSRYSVGLIPWAVVAQGADAIRHEADRLAASGHRYAVVDAITEADLVTIGAAARGMALVTGGSGVAMGLPGNFGVAPAVRRAPPKVGGRSVVLAGSCSEATRQQIDRVKDDWPSLKLDADAIARGACVADAAIDWACATNGTPLIFASADPDQVARTQDRYGPEHAGAMVEKTFADIARGLVAQDFRRIVVAGGETSGAVLNGLGITSLDIFDEIDPGVPWTVAPDQGVALALKSGNFGGPDFFAKAFEVLG